MKLKWTLFLTFAVVLPGLLLAQDKPEKSKQKIVIIKKYVDDDGNEVVEKIVKEGDGDEKMEWQDEDGHIVIKLNGGDVEWSSLEDLDIDVDLEGMEQQLRNIDVELEDLDGIKNLKVITEPDGEVFEWEELGDLPEELKERLENKGLRFRRLDGENFSFGPPPNKALLGVKVGQKREMVNENGEVEEVEVSEGEGAAVLDVFEGSAAEEAGIQKGDIITSVDGEAIEDFEALVETLSDKAPGDQVSVGFLREGQALTVEATLKGRDTAPSVYEFRLDDDGNDFHFFSDDDDDDDDHGKRHRKVIVIQDGNVIVEREDGDEEDAFFSEPDEAQPALELEAFEAFPNPADNQLTVRFTGVQAPVTIRLLDAAGKQVYKEFIKDFEGKYDQQIGLEGVPEGLLLLTVEQEGRVFAEKVMIARQ